MTAEDLDVLGRHLLPKIEASAADGRLAKAPGYFHILHAWMQLSGPEAPKAWLAAVVGGSVSALATAARGLLSFSTEGGRRSYALRSDFDGNLYDVAVLLAACRKHRGLVGTTPDEAARLGVLERGLERLAAAP